MGERLSEPCNSSIKCKNILWGERQDKDIGDKTLETGHGRLLRLLRQDMGDSETRHCRLLRQDSGDV